MDSRLQKTGTGGGWFWGVLQSQVHHGSFLFGLKILGLHTSLPRTSHSWTHLAQGNFQLTSSLLLGGCRGRFSFCLLFRFGFFSNKYVENET